MKKGAIKVSVLYPSGEGKTFDMDYYCNKHVALVNELLGGAIIGTSIEEGLAGGAPDSQPTYVAMGNMYFESIESYQNSLGPHVERIMGDILNFTNIEPVIQVSKVLI